MMPPDRRLPDPVLDDFRVWIKRGAPGLPEEKGEPDCHIRRNPPRRHRVAGEPGPRRANQDLSVSVKSPVGSVTRQADPADCRVEQGRTMGGGGHPLIPDGGGVPHGAVLEPGWSHHKVTQAARGLLGAVGGGPVRQVRVVADRRQTIAGADRVQPVGESVGIAHRLLDINRRLGGAAPPGAGCAGAVGVVAVGAAAGGPSARAVRAEGPERLNSVVRAIVATVVLVLMVLEKVNALNSLVRTRARVAPCDPIHATLRGCLACSPGDRDEPRHPCPADRMTILRLCLQAQSNDSTENPDFVIP